MTLGPKIIIFTINYIFIASILLISCSSYQYNFCKSISNSKFESLILAELIDSKSTSKNNLILGKFTDDEILNHRLDRNALEYDDSASGVMFFYNDKKEKLFEARLYNDCEIQWIYNNNQS
jgi:hypothetical protein